MHGGIVFSGFFFLFFFVVYSGKSVWAFFLQELCGISIREKDHSLETSHHNRQKNEKDASIFMEVFYCFSFFLSFNDKVI